MASTAADAPAQPADADQMNDTALICGKGKQFDGVVLKYDRHNYLDRPRFVLIVFRCLRNVCQSKIKRTFPRLVILYIHG
jgi:hypothetical protein